MAIVRPETVRDLLSENSGEPYLELVTVIASGFPNEYLVLNSEDIISRNVTYKAAYFEVEAPKKTGEELPMAQITFSNVDRRLVEAVRSVEDPPEIILELVALSRPDIVEEGPYNFTLHQTRISENSITGQLGYEKILSERFPYGTYTPGDFPAVFA